MDDFVKYDLPDVLQVSKIVTIFYMELPKDFQYAGEKHNFWEMVYMDKGEMLCTADKNQFTLKSGEVTFHKPNEYHNLSGTSGRNANVGIVTFECSGDVMNQFDGKILRLDAEEKALLSMLFSEGLSCFRLEDPQNPLLQKLQVLPDAPFGSFQMTKSLLELFLIRVYRHKNALSKQSRRNVYMEGMDVPYEIKEILDVLESRIYVKTTISDVAKAVGKSQSTVKSLFSKYHPGGIMRYYNTRKLKEAKRLIRENRHTFSQIAELLHFDSPQYFSKCFHDYAHMTPSEYKRSIMR